jgi:tetratricopeptide (TPR) repeat protein
MRAGSVTRAALACAVCLAVAAAAPVDDALALLKQKRYPEARAALEKILAADPANAPACYYLALDLQRGPEPSLDQARGWLEKAVKLAPDKEPYLAEYGGVSLLIADRDNSFVAALEGRNAMVKAIAMNPADLDARDGLMQFYAKAPWPLGDPDKALELAAEIGKRDPRKGSAAYLLLAKVFKAQGHADREQAAADAAQRLAPRRAD